jgi:Domain of unknown function (DUF4259)
VGIWGPGAFQNDTACDLLLEILDGGDLPLLEEMLDGVLASRGQQDLTDATSGIAAAELVARLCARPSLRTPAPEEVFVESEVGPDLSAVDAWVEHRRSALTEALADKARRAMALVLSETADLQKYWRDAQSFTAWRREVECLIERLR